MRFDPVVATLPLHTSPRRLAAQGILPVLVVFQPFSLSTSVGVSSHYYQERAVYMGLYNDLTCNGSAIRSISAITLLTLIATTTRWMACT